jgi:hypothetical protein
MTQGKIILDPDSLAKLESAPNGAEVCNTAGRTVGVFVTPEWYRQLLSAWENANFDEELARKADEDFKAGRYKTTTQVLELFKKLDAGGAAGQ